ncbi:hypothetical protein [Sphingopyxis sp. JAI128]|uniref:hypothetical protein n=1 Tax=Sphingopyxis sp. JAI128 TaxID=2723066 RepID=UPI001824096E|nr:hypothetical protein [Sphingopyxis sp. JAI128]MBB6428029.1 hypothetical protein [Sphingopyxis sp. JAI128]
MADESLAARFARTIRALLVPPPSVSDFEEHPDPLIARLEWAIACLPEQTREVFWNGSLPPIGYRVVAAEQRGAKVKKRLEIDPFHAETVRTIFRLALEGDGVSGSMGVKAIAANTSARLRSAWRSMWERFGFSARKAIYCKR